MNEATRLRNIEAFGDRSQLKLIFFVAIALLIPKEFVYLSTAILTCAASMYFGGNILQIITNYPNHAMRFGVVGAAAGCLFGILIDFCTGTYQRTVGVGGFQSFDILFLMATFAWVLSIAGVASVVFEEFCFLSDRSGQLAPKGVRIFVRITLLVVASILVVGLLSALR